MACSDSLLGLIRSIADGVVHFPSHCRRPCIIEGRTPLYSCTISPTLARSMLFVGGSKVRCWYFVSSLPCSPAPRSPFSHALPFPSTTELKKNCDSDLIIYIVGAKADLHRHREITSDLARHSLHTWFPPPQPVIAPPPPPPSTLSYIRPRFTSFPSMRGASASPPSTDDSGSSPIDNPVARGLQRSNTSAIPRLPAAPLKRPSRQRANTMNTGPQAGSRLGSSFGSAVARSAAGWNELGDGSSGSLHEEDENLLDDDTDEQEWGLGKDMELFEVSAKDDLGQCCYFVCDTV